MPPQAIQLGLFVLEQAIKNAPELYADLQKLFTKAEATAADFEELRAKVGAKSYRDYVPQTALPPA